MIIKLFIISLFIVSFQRWSLFFYTLFQLDLYSWKGNYFLYNFFEWWGPSCHYSSLKMQAHHRFIQLHNNRKCLTLYAFLNNSYILTIVLINTVHNDSHISFLCKVRSLEHITQHICLGLFFIMCVTLKLSFLNIICHFITLSLDTIIFSVAL